MLVGRLVGWLLIGVSGLMASADAVLALGPGEHVGIVTRDVWMLLSGRPWDAAAASSLATLLMAWPAWTVLAPLGLLTVWLSRQRRKVRTSRFD
jgi:hypothetical protein